MCAVCEVVVSDVIFLLDLLDGGGVIFPFFDGGVVDFLFSFDLSLNVLRSCCVWHRYLCAIVGTTVPVAMALATFTAWTHIFLLVTSQLSISSHLYWSKKRSVSIRLLLLMLYKLRIFRRSKAASSFKRPSLSLLWTTSHRKFHCARVVSSNIVTN